MKDNNRMTATEVYCHFFPDWFKVYTSLRGIDLFLAGRYCTLTMNLILNPFKLGTTEYELGWGGVCQLLLEIDPHDEAARKSLIADVIQYGVEEYNLKSYTSTTTINGKQESETYFTFWR